MRVRATQIGVVGLSAPSLTHHMFFTPAVLPMPD